MQTDTRPYEIAVWIRLEAEDSADGEAVARVREKLSETGAEILSHTKAVRRRISYPIKKAREGIFIVFDARMDPQNTGKAIEAFKHDTDIIRIGITKKDGRGDGAPTGREGRRIRQTTEEIRPKVEMSQLEKKLEEILHGN